MGKSLSLVHTLVEEFASIYIVLEGSREDSDEGFNMETLSCTSPLVILACSLDRFF